jgi:RNA-directed DNA polymerase
MQKISQETYSPKEAVNTSGHGRGQSSDSVRTEGSIHARKHNGLMERILCKENLKKAYQRVKNNNGAPGTDGVRVDELNNYLRENWGRIRKELYEGTYRPQVVRRVEIPKSGGGVRLLGIPTVIDRLIQQAILQILGSLYDPMFSPYSYGFRPGRGAHMAIRQAQKYIREGYSYVVDADIEKFFDRINHDILMSKLTKKIGDGRILRLIRQYLQSGVMINGCCVATDEGAPQGGPLSPLLANIMLDDLDKELEQRGHRFIRYADDCNIYVKSKRAAQRVLEGITRFVGKRLKLKVNKEKSAADRPWRRKMLGLSFLTSTKASIRLADTTRKRVKERIRELTRRTSGKSLEEIIRKLNEYLRGWVGYFAIAQTRSVFEELDEWIRRRLRAILLARWKRSITKRRELQKLGIPEKWARNISGSRKKYWRLSKTHQMHKALGIAYWHEQGLMSVVKRYDELRCTS